MPTELNAEYLNVMKANVEVHSLTVAEYNNEPHFRPENIAIVEGNLKKLANSVQAEKLLDLGCGTGFMIDIAKKYVSEIDGVDITQAMLDKVDQSGNCKISLIHSDTGSFEPALDSYDLVTAYSFLHHLYDIRPTLKTAYKALKSGGKFYADLDPNYYFWEDINDLDRNGSHDPIIKREIEMVSHIDENLGKRFSLNPKTINLAEYGKNVKGGFKEEELKELLLEAGFKSVELNYFWYIGQGYIINHAEYAQAERQQYAKIMDEVLKKAMPLSRNLYKYLGFVATK